MKEFGTDLPGVKQQNLNLFNSQYPIISVLMNQVSEESLAIAISKAGGFPSISGYCYNSAEEIITALEKFVAETSRSDLILGIDEKLFFNSNLIAKIKELRISHIFRYVNEDPLISDETRSNWRKITDKILKDLSCFKISLRYDYKPIVDMETIYFIKGNDGAGRPGSASTKELFDFHITNSPNARLVPTGAIGNCDQVEYYLKAGAVAVGCGTLFAASRESILSIESKNALVKSTKKDLSKVDNNLNQLGLVFSNLESDNVNNTLALKEGIASGNKGLIFAGNAVDAIDRIYTVEEIIKKLTSKIA